MVKTNNLLTEGPIAKTLTSLTIPMIFGMLSIVIFNLVDTYFVGKIGVNELAAMGFTFPVVSFVMSLATGLGIGTSSLISRLVISSKKEKVQRYSVNALLLAIFIIFIFVTAGQLTITPLFKALGASDKLIPLITEYMGIWYWGMAFLIVPIVGNSIIRATGDTLTPGIIMIISAIINIVLDPIFIFGFGPVPAMGLKGAAIATVISRALSFGVSLYILIYRDKLITIYIPKLKNMLKTWGDIIYVAGPSAMSILITPISIAIITGLISTYGDEAVAGFGVVSKLELLFMMVVSSLGSVITIFTGQNFGNKSFPRILKALNMSSLFSILWGAMLFIISIFTAEYLAALFSDHKEVIDVASSYLKIVSIGYGLQGVLIIGISTLNGLNKPFIALLLTFIRMVGIYVPLAYIGSNYMGLNGIFFACLLANLISGIVMYKITKKEILAKIELVN